MQIQGNAIIPATNGNMAAYVARPKGITKHAAVLIQVELWGMTQHMREVAERLADEGYTVVVCDLFRGTAPPEPSDPVQFWADTFNAFDDVRCTRDCRMALSWVLSEDSQLDVDAAFAWGFCMGGRFAHNLGAFDRRLNGVINFYGRVNFPRMSNKPFLPIELTTMIEMPYLGVFAETDGLIPQEDVERIKHDLSWNPANQVLVFEGTEHAFFNDHRESYNKVAAQKAWTNALAFLECHLNT